MSESKCREATGHRLPAGMMNVSGRHVTDLARGIRNLLERPFNEGMQADIATHIFFVSAVDLWQANHGDAYGIDLLRNIAFFPRKTPSWRFPVPLKP